MNKLIVRITILYCALYILYVLYYAWNGINVFDDSYKLFLEYCLYIQASTDKKYNCKYMRFLALALFITDTISVLDMQFDFMPTATISLAILSTIWAVSIISTIILAVNHYRKVRKIKKIRDNGPRQEK